jgi:hypothetical protein
LTEPGPRPKKFAEGGVWTRERTDDVLCLVSKPALEAHLEPGV